MKNRMNKEILQKIKFHIITKMNSAYQFTNFYYQKLNKRQRRVLSAIGFILLLVVLMAVGSLFIKHQSNADYPVQFQTKATVKNVLPSKPSSPTVVGNDMKLQNQLDALKVSSSQQFQAMQEQLQMIQSSLSSLPSFQDIQQWQLQSDEPNKALLNKVSDLQNTMQKIVKQTAEKIWVNPKVVEKYFRLIAVQGFSDGMRAIVDIDGNQTTLSVHELCPWMDSTTNELCRSKRRVCKE
jgi:hypothetical protein